MILPSGIECDSIEIDQTETHTNLRVKNECIDDSILSELYRLVDLKVDSKDHQIFKDIKTNHELANSNYFGFDVEVIGIVSEISGDGSWFKIEVDDVKQIRFKIMLRENEDIPLEDSLITFSGRIQEITERMIRIINHKIY